MKFLAIAFKNIFRQKKRSFTLGINYLVVSLLMVLIFSFSEGVNKNFTGNVIAASAGHVTLSGESVIKGKVTPGINNFPLIQETLEKEFSNQARSLVRYSMVSTIYHSGLSKRLSFTGINTQKDLSLKDQLNFNQGSWNDFADSPSGFLVSQEVADYLGLKLGDEVVVSARTRFGAFNTATFQVKGIYSSANYFIQGLVVTHFDTLQALDLAPKGNATNIYIYFQDLKDLGAKREKIIQILNAAGYKAAPPENSNEALAVVASASLQYKEVDPSISEFRIKAATVYEVIGLLTQILAGINATGTFLAAILFFIIAISIFINMRMTINDRMQEIGTLKAIGTEPRTIISMLLFENVFLSVLFVLIGLGIGLFVIFLLSNVITLPPAGILSLFLDGGHLVMIPTFGSMAMILGITVLFTALFSYFPARYGGKIPAVVALNKTF